MIFLLYWTENLENVSCGIVGTRRSDAGRWKTLRVPVVIGGDNLPSTVGIGWTDLLNIASGPPWPPQFRHHCGSDYAMLTNLKYKFARPWRTHTKWRRNQKTLRKGGQISESTFSVVLFCSQSNQQKHCMSGGQWFLSLILLNMGRSYKYPLKLGHLKCLFCQFTCKVGDQWSFSLFWK